MTREQFFRMLRCAGLLVAAVLFVWLVFSTCGCTTTETVYERVEVPVPYWSPPSNIAPPPPRPILQAGDISREDAEADPKTALQTVGQDLDAALAWGEALLHVYIELVKLVLAEPVDTTLSDGSGTSPGG
jgi:hypothetical protein